MGFSQGKIENLMLLCYDRGKGSRIKNQLMDFGSGNNSRTEFRQELLKIPFSVVSEKAMSF